MYIFNMCSSTYSHFFVYYHDRQFYIAQRWYMLYIRSISLPLRYLLAPFVTYMWFNRYLFCWNSQILNFCRTFLFAYTNRVWKINLSRPLSCTRHYHYTSPLWNVQCQNLFQRSWFKWSINDLCSISSIIIATSSITFGTCFLLRAYWFTQNPYKRFS